MADIDKILNIKLKIKLKTIIPEQYWGYLNVFKKRNQSIIINSWGKNHEIELLEKEKKNPTVFWGPLYNISKT